MPRKSGLGVRSHKVGVTAQGRAQKQGRFRDAIRLPSAQVSGLSRLGTMTPMTPKNLSIGEVLPRSGTLVESNGYGTR